MNYTSEIIIDRPIDEVVNLFDNSENMKKWMEGLQNYEHLSGSPGEPGAKTKLYFKMGKRDIEMTKTIISKDLPRELIETYDAKNVHNIQSIRFIAVDDNKTKFIADNEFQFSGFMKIMAFFLSGSFRKASMKYMKDLKNFIEGQ